MFSQNYVMIDLHGLSVQEAKAVLEKQFSLIKEDNVTQFYIITGRGNHQNANGTRAVLKNALPRLLKPYCHEIMKIDKELGSFKITLKSTSELANDSLKNMLKSFFDTEKMQSKFFRTLEAQAQKGDMNALIGIAVIYISGEVKDFCNKQKGIDLLHQAKDLGSLEAYAILGEFYLDGVYVDKNYQEAIKLLRYAAERNHAAAQFWLGKCYAHGQGIKRNDKTALDWLERSAKQGYIDAEFTMGLIYFNGEMAPEDNHLAVKYFSRAATKNHTSAMSYLGRCYACGYGVEIDYNQAFFFYEKAAASNDIYALHMVGQYYWQGRILGKRNYSKALEYFQRGADLGDADCQIKIGHAYLHGLGLKQDIMQGMQWVHKALEQKNMVAYYTMANAHKNGIGAEKNIKEAQRFLELAAKAGLPQAQFELAMELLVDKAMPFNREAGLDWLKKAVDNNHPEALSLMQRILNKGASSSQMAIQPTLFNSSSPISTFFREHAVSNGAVQVEVEAEAEKEQAEEDYWDGLRSPSCLVI